MTLITRLKQIAKDSSIYGLSQVLSQLVGFLLLPVYTYYLTPKDYGVLAMLSLIIIVIPPFVNLGLNNAVFRFYNECKAETEKLQLIGTSHLLVCLFSSLCLAVLVLFSGPLCLWLIDSTAHVLSFNLTVLCAWFTSMSTIPLVVLKQQRKVKQIAMRSFLGLCVNVLTTLFFVVYLEWGVLGSVLGNVAGGATSALLVIIAVRKETWRFFSKERIRSLLGYSLPFVPYFLQAVIMSIIGQYIVKEYVGLEDAGFYSIAWRFVLPLALVLGAFNNSWAAFKFDIRFNDPDPKKSYREIFSFYTVVVGIGWLLVSLWMPEILKMVVAPLYHDATNLIPILALIPLIQNIRSMLTTGFEMAVRPRFLPLITFFGLVVLLIACYLLLPLYKVTGVAISVVVGWTATAIITYFYSQRIYPISYNAMLFVSILSFVFMIHALPLREYLIAPDLFVVILKTFIGLSGCLCLYLILDKSSYGKRLMSKLAE
jgi:O-antigen/teichoic acid export membrane protein